MIRRNLFDGGRCSRRQLLHGVVLPMLQLGKGCVSVPTHRELSTRRISILERDDEEVVLEVEIIRSAGGGTDEWETLHGVRLLGYTFDGRLTCERKLGTLDDSFSSPTFVHLGCEKRPDMLTFDMEESVCEEDTTIHISDYQDIREGEHFWTVTRDRQCDQGLPPPPPEDRS